MRIAFPLLPLAGATLARGLADLAARCVRVVNAAMLAQRNRRAAQTLARLDRHMLADIGISRSDLRDAFSSPFWDDPTALLRERALEKRLYRPTHLTAVPRAIEPAAGTNKAAARCRASAE